MISSTHSLPALKLLCSSSIKPSVTLPILATRIPAYIFSNHAYYTITFRPFFFTHVQWNTHIEGLQSSGTTPLSKAMLHSFQIQSTTLSSPSFIISPVTSTLSASFLFLSFPHSYLNPHSPNQLSSEVVASPGPISATHVDWNLFLGVYIIGILKILLPNPSHFKFFQCLPPISVLYFAAILQFSTIRLMYLLPEQLPFTS